MLKREYYPKRKKKWDLLENEGELLLPRKGRKKKSKKRKESREREKGKEKGESLEEFSEEEEDPMCLSAHSSLMLPIGLEFRDSKQITELLLKRKIEIEGEVHPIWYILLDFPPEANDLNHHFRQSIGFRAKKSLLEKPRTWGCTRLRMKEEVLKALFPVTKVRVIQEEQVIEYHSTFLSIDLIIYPRGSCILSYNIDWKSQEMELSICDMRTLIFASKHLHRVERVFQGWSFTPSSVYPTPFIPNALQILGTDLYQARFEDESISLMELSQWVLNFSPENYEIEGLEELRNAYHHSSVVLEKEPNMASLYEYLFHMRRAFGQTNRPPINSEEILGKVLVWRRNRYLGISREGIVSISWPTPAEGSLEYETNQWHKKFLGIYQILAIHVHAERLVFGDLSDLAADESDNWLFETDHPTLKQMKQSRDKLRNLATQLARYTLGMSSADCGGTTEYYEFFVTLRNVLGIPDLRQELSQELKDVLAVVESSYLEEERRQRHKEEEGKREKFLIEQKFQKEKEDHDRRFEAVVSLIGAFTLPYVLVGG